MGLIPPNGKLMVLVWALGNLLWKHLLLQGLGGALSSSHFTRPSPVSWELAAPCKGGCQLWSFPSVFCSHDCTMRTRGWSSESVSQDVVELLFLFSQGWRHIQSECILAFSLAEFCSLFRNIHVLTRSRHLGGQKVKLSIVPWLKCFKGGFTEHKSSCVTYTHFYRITHTSFKIFLHFLSHIGTL